MRSRWFRLGATLGAAVTMSLGTVSAQSPGVASLSSSDSPGVARLSEPAVPGTARVGDSVDSGIITGMPIDGEIIEGNRRRFAEHHRERFDNLFTQIRNRDYEIYGDVNYMLFFTKGAPVGGAFVTTGTLNRGQLGLADTQVLFGNERVDAGVVSGISHRFGADFDGFFTQGGGFWLPKTITKSTFQSNAMGDPLIARPFIDSATGANETLAASLPGFAPGLVAVQSELEVRSGEFTLGMRPLEADKDLPLTIRLGGGFRYFHLQEALQVDSFTNLGAGFPASFNGGTLVGPGTLVVSDRFDTDNKFYGGQVVAAATYRSDLFFANVITKLAMGTVQQELNVRGFTNAQLPGGTLSATGGLLAQPSNIGGFSRSGFAVIPEVGLQLGVRLTEHITGIVGYEFVYISNVLRPGDQIDPTVSITQLQTSPTFNGNGNRPATQFVESDFWAQGITFGLSIAY
ncbi:BBP7 family outer membrane beta-barrel protein [Tuwongella immobilis]|uniref:Uncharacterized protein n=1 Tax=Tuwongella immobilis TaxID=692036 RepID=A0A6C2YRB7_9BACT|nr:BBP7 family outer membrane beta-barrel protein [Tuwongella immobilis]VIP04200.1 Secreted protein containing DUF1551 OS=Rhodopirellula sallentina SM41 GN=RSSM_00079 PE=4 SV=1: DUF1551 [Tuwongella immobilis]VTS05764.1 Secreted protein containing DUF1551 OS=Rhodopirellula sallentina SM41 GN=RSSM_00079 PE=4 SV=1: DUF1551 [Tuwongella immobilis]